MLFVVGVSLLIGPLSGRAIVLIYTQMHLFASLSNKNHMATAILHSRDHSRVFPFHDCNSLFWWWETKFPLSLVFLFKQSIPLRVSNRPLSPPPPPQLRHPPAPAQAVTHHSRPLPCGWILTLPFLGADTSLQVTNVQPSLRTTESSQVELHVSLFISHLPLHYCYWLLVICKLPNMSSHKEQHPQSFILTAWKHLILWETYNWGGGPGSTSSLPGCSWCFDSSPPLPSAEGSVSIFKTPRNTEDSLVHYKLCCCGEDSFLLILLLSFQFESKWEFPLSLIPIRNCL